MRRLPDRALLPQPEETLNACAEGLLPPLSSRGEGEKRQRLQRPVIRSSQADTVAPFGGGTGRKPSGKSMSTMRPQDEQMKWPCVFVHESKRACER